MSSFATKIKPAVCISPISVSDNTAQVGTSTDILGFNAVTFVIAIGSVADADATFAVTMDESSDNSSWSAVPSKYLVGTLADAGFTFASDNSTRKIGYSGHKRYVRLTITPTANASAAVFSAVALLGDANVHPTV